MSVLSAVDPGVFMPALPMQALCLNKAFAKRCDKFKTFKPGKSLRDLVSFCPFKKKKFQKCIDLSVYLTLIED